MFLLLLVLLAVVSRGIGGDAALLLATVEESRSTGLVVVCVGGTRFPGRCGIIVLNKTQ